MPPQIIFSDEPTSALDQEMIGEVLDIRRIMAKEVMTMMVLGLFKSLSKLWNFIIQ